MAFSKENTEICTLENESNCCLAEGTQEKNSDNPCENNTKDCCCHQIMKYVAVVFGETETTVNDTFIYKTNYPKYDNSFVSAYLNTPFHPPRHVSV